MSSQSIENFSTNRLFGSSRRTEVLLGIALLEETYARELARVLQAPLLSVQRIVDALDREGVIATRLIGQQRRVTLNPKYFARKELEQLLRRLAQGDQRLLDAVGGMRRRPRRKGKPL
jgi:alpha-D-ribose 1-methylphosphonate 5-triphosphate synthase subunit PhnI